jgi:hypothetical protein
MLRFGRRADAPGKSRFKINADGGFDRKCRQVFRRCKNNWRNMVRRAVLADGIRAGRAPIRGFRVVIGMA